MAVKNNATQFWKGGVIPYADHESVGKIRQFIDAFNAHFTTPLFVPRPPAECAGIEHAEFLITDKGGHSGMGRPIKEVKQVIKTPPSLHSVLHEMGHCAGLGHEHFHPMFLIGDGRPGFADAVLHAWVLIMAEAEKRNTATRGMSALDFAGKKQEQKVPDWRRDFKLERELTQAKQYEVVGPYDVDSIMMYTSWRDAARVAEAALTRLVAPGREDLERIITRSDWRGSPDPEKLSRLDCEVLQRWYGITPRP